MTTKKATTSNKKKNSKTTAASLANKTQDPTKGVTIMTRLLGSNLVQGVPEKSASSKTDVTVIPKLVSTAEILKKKEFVGLYLAAQWSNKSLEFTPKLIEFYNQLNKGSNGKSVQDSLEIVYVSVDQNREQFNEHFLGIDPPSAADNGNKKDDETKPIKKQPMPWYAMESETPQQAKLKNDLVPIFKSYRIPCLIILHVPTGQFVTENGKDDILQIFCADPSKTSSDGDKAKKPTSDKNKLAIEVVEKWKTAPLDSMQNAQYTVGYNAGMMKIVKYFLQNPYAAAILIAILLLTPIIKTFIDKPLLLVAVFYFVKKWTDVPGDSTLPALPFDEMEETKIEKKNK